MAAPRLEPDAGWRRPRVAPSLAEVYRTVPVQAGGWWRKALAFAGPGYLVAVGYMDPGNWATDLAGGSRFGYTLLSVILLSNLMAILLQGLASKLGIVTGRDLAQACRDHYSRPASFLLWILCEVAIAACDLAEVIGSAIALGPRSRSSGWAQYSRTTWLPIAPGGAASQLVVGAPASPVRRSRRP
jgi:manganese transport protein